MRFTENFLRHYLAVIKLRLNSACSASPCKGITSLINTPKKRRIFDAPQKCIFHLRSYVLFQWYNTRLNKKFHIGVNNKRK